MLKHCQKWSKENKAKTTRHSRAREQHRDDCLKTNMKHDKSHSSLEASNPPRTNNSEEKSLV